MKDDPFSLLQDGANGLARADKNKNLRAMAGAHKRIRKCISDIYINEVDIPTVLRVEKILHSEQVNETIKARAAFDMLDRLIGQAGSGLEAYGKYQNSPRIYMEYAWATRKNVTFGRHSLDEVPVDPVRSAFIEMRKELIAQLKPTIGDPFFDREETNRMRFEALVGAEENYLVQCIDHRKYATKAAKEDAKAECLASFRRRMKTELRKIEPINESQRA